MFNRRKDREAGGARVATARYDRLQEFLRDAQTFEGVDAVDVPDMRLPIASGERVFLCVHGASLVEARGHDGRRGERAPGLVDRGEFVLTTTRAVFTGSKQIRQWAWSHLVGVDHADDGPWTMIRVSNRRRTFGVMYDDEHEDQMRFSIDLAVASGQGRRDALVQRLSDEMRAIQSSLLQPDATHDVSVSC